MTTLFLLNGGLDLTKPALAADPGTLTDCMNFERAVEDGYRRCDGVVPFDGVSPDPGTVMAIDFDFVLGTGGGVTFAQITARVTYDVFFIKTVGYTQSAEITPVPSTVVVQSLGGGQVQVTGTGYMSPVGVVPPSDASGALYTQKSVYTDGAEFNIDATTFTAQGAPATIFQAGFDEITPVPGRQDGDGVQSDVHFTHMYRDDVYAARDYQAYTIRGTSTQANISVLVGDWVTNGVAFAKIVEIDGAFQYEKDTRIVVHNEDGGKFADGDTIRLVTRGALTLPIAMGGFHAALSTYLFSPGGAELGTVTDFPSVTSAGLYQTTDGGWREVDQRHEVRFRAGVAAMADLRGTIRGSQVSNVDAADISSTGLIFGTSGQSIRFITSGNAVVADDGTYTSTTTAAGADVTGNLCGLKVVGFDTAGIPLNATILGIEVEIQRKNSNVGAANWVQDLEIALCGVGTRTDGVTGAITNLSADNKALRTERWIATDITKTYGSPSDTWGQLITADKIRSTDFGILIGVERAFNTGTAQYDALVEIDYVKVNVHYMTATSKVYFYNANATPTDVQADVVHVHLISGAYTDSDAEGILTVRCQTDASSGRQVGAGDVIRTAPAGAGTPYATVSDSLKKVTLPSQADLDENASQYRAITENFYGSEDFEAIYAVSGAGPAWTYDTHDFIRVQPDLTSDLNKPRHIAKHGDMLAIAFKNGSVLTSVVGEPLNMRGVDGATEVAFGDRVTGILSLEQDVLGVFCRKRIYGLRGLASSAFQTTIIRPNSGAIEYTVADMGDAVYTDSFGINFLETTDRFGDFLPSRTSYKVWPWLRPRVQARSSNADLRVKHAYAVRNKNTYVVQFNDGYSLRMTLVGPERDPQFTIARYQYNDGTNLQVMVPRHVSSQIDGDGVERMFASMAYASRWNLAGQQYVYELEKLWFFVFWDGSEFDANPIQAHMVTNWHDEKDPLTHKHYEQFYVYGRSQFPVTFQAARSVNYALTVDASGNATPTVDVQFGYAGEQVPSLQYNRIGVAEMPIEGRDIAIRFESEAADTPPFTLSAVHMISQSMGRTRGHVRT